MNLQREAYLMNYQRQLLADQCNARSTQRQLTNRRSTKISDGLRQISQIRGIHIHVTFDMKDPVKQVRRANA
ncbi:MAG: hypothetical protein H6669_03820 [Ardenticatenaceae bacterium]|nr:hypothetical protein [Ardenticatenaceae bacterium]